MSTTLPIILGIDPGARQIGVSVLSGEKLIFYAVKTFKKRTQDDSLSKLREVIRRLIAEYEPQCIAVEKIVFVQQHRSFVKIAYEEIKEFVRSQDIKLFEYNPKLIRQIICGVERPTKRNSALIIAQKYPELARYFNVSRIWQKRYFAQLFDAIAASLTCLREIKETELLLAHSPSKETKESNNEVEY